MLYKTFTKETIFNIWISKKYFSVLLIYQLFAKLGIWGAKWVLKQQNLCKNDCKSDLIMIITLITTYEFLYTGCSIWIFPILNSFENCQIYPFFYHENYLMHYGEGENDRYVPIPK